MDPRVMIRMINRAIEDKDFEGAQLFLTDVWEWSNKGGFIPEIKTNVTFMGES